MRIYFAGDHAGFEMKSKLMEFVRSLGHEVEDLGPFSYEAGDDYPDYVIPLAMRIAKAQIDADTETRIDADTNSADKRRLNIGVHLPAHPRSSAVRGIVVAGSGQGEIIAMNRVRGARAALFCPCSCAQINADESADKRRLNPSLELVKASRDHNDSNIFTIGARFCTLDEAKKGITVWLETPFSNVERHVRRLVKIDAVSL